MATENLSTWWNDFFEDALDPNVAGWGQAFQDAIHQQQRTMWYSGLISRRIGVELDTGAGPHILVEPPENYIVVCTDIFAFKTPNYDAATGVTAKIGSDGSHQNWHSTFATSGLTVEDEPLWILPRPGGTDIDGSAAVEIPLLIGDDSDKLYLEILSGTGKRADFYMYGQVMEIY